MNRTIYIALNAALLGLVVGFFAGALLISQANYTACLEKGIAVEVCREIRR